MEANSLISWCILAPSLRSSQGLTSFRWDVWPEQRSVMCWVQRLGFFQQLYDSLQAVSVPSMYPEWWSEGAFSETSSPCCDDMLFLFLRSFSCSSLNSPFTLAFDRCFQRLRCAIAQELRTATSSLRTFCSIMISSWEWRTSVFLL